MCDKAVLRQLLTLLYLKESPPSPMHLSELCCSLQTKSLVLNLARDMCRPTMQGCMQDKIIASHTCFGGHMDVNC